MRELAAVGSLGLTVGLALSRPHLGTHYRVGPALAALAGCVVMAAAGYIGLDDVETALDVLWRPLLAITAIMVLTAAALRLGSIERLAAAVLPRADGSAERLFLLVFALAAGTSAVLNNDSAVLLLTPLVVVWIQGRYPERPDLIVPFAFAVFMAAGVAPLVTANPMNLIVADAAGLDFNHYALRMLPIAVAGWAVTFLVLRLLFRRELASAASPSVTGRRPAAWTASQWQGVAVVLVVLGAYPVVSYFDGSVWVVALLGASLATLVCMRHQGRAAGRELVVRGVSWEILVFLLGVFLLALGLRNAGLVDSLSDLYEGAGLAVVGVTSALGSALINNHSMALTNLLALDATPGSGTREYMAALIGGDLGPRLLPMGSLAGLLWFMSLRRLDVDVPVGRFVVVGAAATVPTLAVSLGLLALLT